MITNPFSASTSTTTTNNNTHHNPRIVVGGIDARLAAFHAIAGRTTSPEKTATAQLREVDLRKRIREIYQDASLDESAKARKVQCLMSPPVPKTLSSEATHTESPLEKGFHDVERGILGCCHYQRKAKIKAICCDKIYTCHLCHDEASDHLIDRHKTTTMLCMMCKTLQPVAKNCSKCHTDLGKYYCDVCHLWNDNSPQETFHCNACGICRHGRQSDFFHCNKCNICMTISMKNNHKCIEHSLESDCPICGDYMFTSRTTIAFLPCGHSLHKTCYSDYSKRAYQCPTCLKSMTDMSAYFRLIDDEHRKQTMPAEYDGVMVSIFCNDCEKRSDTKYQFFHHKCYHCHSYNTAVLHTHHQKS